MREVDKIRGIICQKILPLTYDESVSYYEFLCKVLKKLNEIIVVINQIDFDKIEDLRKRLEACEQKNIEQDDRIGGLGVDILTLYNYYEGLYNDMQALTDRVNTLDTLVNMHTAELADHEVRITELEKYYSQMLLKKEVANLHVGDVFDMEAEQFERSEINI